MLGVSVVVFVVTRLLIDPTARLVPIGSSQEQYDAAQAAHGFDRSIPAQFVDFMGDLVRLDFGRSVWLGGDARTIVVERMPATLVLVGASIGLAVLIAVPTVVIAVLKPGSWLDRIATTGALFGIAVPSFWLGALLILLFSVNLGWLPTSGGGDLQHLVLPAIALALPSAGRLAQVGRAAVLEQMQERYITAVLAKGMSRRRAVVFHALRNAAAPILSILTWEVSRAISSGTVVVETVFGWPGVGQLAVSALQRGDVFVIQAVVFLVAVTVVVVNALGDAGLQRVDPRTRAAAR
ncbi:MAG TPA: ABC transporter permease [Acidimicrobiales bacterium]|nr:ABC transporter permease [Acidimicrobiales bacterium]